ncbi:MAG TPA: 50S ribosomal protein L27, partial [SAR86 cluster bacterium]|nr:50S ribosomal protein L27 [SAR86 cluster bacterium]
HSLSILSYWKTSSVSYVRGVTGSSKNVGCGKDHTLFSKVAGKVSFVKKGPKLRQFVNVDPV